MQPTLTSPAKTATGQSLIPSMFQSTLSRPVFSKLMVAVFVALRLPTGASDAHAGELPAPVAPTPHPLTAARNALREFDRFLDHHPVLEERLRLDPPLTANSAFLKENPVLHNFLRANPEVEAGLGIYPRYYLNRALLRQACAPLSFHELAPLKPLFEQQPELEQALTENPELIRDPGFLDSHPSLRECLVRHAGLARVFLPQTPTQPE